MSDELTSATSNVLQNAPQQGRDAGQTVEIGGDALHTSASGTGLIFGVAVAAIVLVVTFGSLLPAGPPLLAAGYQRRAHAVRDRCLAGTLGLSSTSQSLGQRLGLAVDCASSVPSSSGLV